MFAVIKAAGKQYVAVLGEKIKFDKTFGQKGESVVFDKVLLIANGTDVAVGSPVVDGAQVKGTVVREGRDRKIITLKYKPKKRFKTKRGHRQPFSEVEITDIVTSAAGAQKSAKTEAKEEVPKKKVVPKKKAASVAKKK